MKIRAYCSYVFLLSLSIIALMGCTEPISVKTVVGTYKGTYANGIETFDIRQDGTFTQTFSKNGVQIYSQNGKWKIDGDDVVFQPFLDASSLTNNDGSKPQRFDICRASWDSIYQTIIFSVQDNYIIVKQKKPRGQ